MFYDFDLDFERVTHVCHFYESFEDLRQVALPFVRDGLAKGEHCIYVTNKHSIDDWLIEFQAFGIDVKGELGKGTLNVIASEDWSGSGKFDSVSQARQTLQLLEMKLAEFPAVRFAGDAEWDLDPGDLCHWEATANLVFEGLNVLSLCQYDLNRYSPSVIHAALRTHPFVLYRGRKLANSFYETDQILDNEPHLNDCTEDRGVVEELLAALHAS